MRNWKSLTSEEKEAIVLGVLEQIRFDPGFQEQLYQRLSDTDKVPPFEEFKNNLTSDSYEDYLMRMNLRDDYVDVASTMV